MTARPESRYCPMCVLRKLTDAAQSQLNSVEDWCRSQQGCDEYAEAAVELAKAGVPIEKIIQCLSAIKQSEGAHAFGTINAAHLLAYGMATFASAEPHFVLSLARMAVCTDGRRG